MKFVEARPVKYTRGTAFLTRERGCTLEEILTPIYTIGSCARILTMQRKHLGLGLREAALRLQISAVELSGLERGHLVPERGSDWDTLLRGLDGGD